MEVLPGILKFLSAVVSLAPSSLFIAIAEPESALRTFCAVSDLLFLVVSTSSSLNGIISTSPLVISPLVWFDLPKDPEIAVVSFCGIVKGVPVTGDIIYIEEFLTCPVLVDLSLSCIDFETKRLWLTILFVSLFTNCSLTPVLV